MTRNVEDQVVYKGRPHRIIHVFGPQGSLSFKTNNTAKMTVTSAGYLGMGTTAPGSRMTIVNGAMQA